MNKTILKILIATLTISTLSVVPASAKTTSLDINVPIKMGAMEAKDYDEIIENQGNILTYDDFEEILDAATNTDTNQLSEDEVKKMIVEKINEKTLISSRLRNYELFGKNLNSTELKLVTKYPFKALSVYKDANKALNTAQNLYASNTLYLGNGDAFRHTYWNALMVKSIGRSYAELFATAHEAETPEGADKSMDLSNNEIGRTIGSNFDKNLLQSTIIQYCDNGLLFRFVSGQLVKTDSSGKLN